MEVYTECPVIHEYIEGTGLMQIRLSHECLQDMLLYQALLDTDRTGPISDEEVREWQDMDSLLEGFEDRHEEVIAKYKVQFFKEDDYTPYEPYDNWTQEPNYKFKTK